MKKDRNWVVNSLLIYDSQMILGMDNYGNVIVRRRNTETLRYKTMANARPKQRSSFHMRTYSSQIWYLVIMKISIFMQLYEGNLSNKKFPQYPWLHPLSGIVFIYWI